MDHNTRRAYLNLVDKLKFDTLEIFLGNNKKGELRCIFDLIRHNPAEFQLRVDQGTCAFVKAWLNSDWTYAVKYFLWIFILTWLSRISP